MMDEFIVFTKSLFPSINPYVKDQAMKSIEQFYQTGKRFKFFNYIPYEFLAQGDILSEVPFIRTMQDGSIGKIVTKGMILSNTCSCDHDDDIVIAPMLKIDDLKIDKNNIKKNLHYRLLYFPDSQYKEYAVDFSLSNTYNKDLLNRMIDEKRVKKEASLNQFGFYLFLCKLTICFMRPEDAGVQKDRRDNYDSMLPET